MKVGRGVKRAAGRAADPGGADGADPGRADHGRSAPVRRRGLRRSGAERVAREAGMTRGALYHQFDGKADLFAAVLDQAEPRSPSGSPTP